MSAPTEQELDQILKELAEAHADLEEAEAIFRAATLTTSAEIEAAMKRISDERANVVALQKEREQTARREHAAVTAARKQLDRKTRELKQRLRERTPESIRLGWRGECGRLQVRATRARAELRVDPAILEEMPWIRELEIGGDSPVFEEVNPHVLQRLVRRGDLREEDVEKFMDNDLVTSPRVSVVWGDPTTGDSDT